jgi:HEAT repeat protein
VDASGLDAADAADRAAAAAVLGTQQLDISTAARLHALVESDPDSRVRATALAALARARAPEASAAWAVAARDTSALVRRRAAETAPALDTRVAIDHLLTLLRDRDAWVAEAAAFAIGEREDATATVVDALTETATRHADALVREAAIAALGAIGDPAGLDAVLHGCRDKPAIRRRAVLALAAFEGEAVERALQRALEDNDWQVRQNAEDILAVGGDDP